MDDAGLYEATVPVFRHYLGRVDVLLDGLPPEARNALLGQRLAPHAFTAAEHLATAHGFSVRTVFPLLGRAIPDVADETTDRDGLARFGRELRELLDGIDVADFAGASTRVVRHTAGEAELAQDATTFVTLFALPNFFFHLGTAFAILRAGGADIGKADFDGQHVYAAGFRF